MFTYLMRTFLVILICAALAAPAARAQCPDGTPPPCGHARRAAPAMSVAVLTFENLSADTGDGYLADGLSEELTTRLGQVSRLSLASRTAVRRLRGAADKSTDDIGRLLNVRYLLNGSVRRSGSRLRVAVELVRAAGGAQVWASAYDRSAADLLDIQQDVATQVATAVAGRLLPDERSSLASRPTRSAEAYDAYLRGLLAYQAARQADAVEALERATALDSGFADAWATLSLAHSAMYWFYLDRSPERLARARAAADRAAALAPTSPLAHMALGYFYYWGSRDYGRALQEFSAALVARPNDPTVHSALANVARRQGDWEQSIASRERSLALDPDNRQELTELGLTFHALRRYEEARGAYDRSFAASGNYDFNYLFASGLALMRDGSIDSAQPMLAFIAAHAEDFVGRTFHDPGIAIPVWRAGGPHQAAVLAATPTRTPEQRAVHYLVVGSVLRTQHRPAAGAFDSVVAIMTALLADRPDDDGFHEQLSIGYAGVGRCDEAVREGRRSVQLLPVSADAFAGPQRLQSLAEIEAGCGQADSAIAHLRNLLSMPSFVSRQLLRADPVWTPLRADPRFQALAAGP